MHQADVEAVAERPHHLLGLARAQQAVIDEDAGELVADRLVDQHRGDRRIDAAGQAADHPPVAHLRADARDLRVAKAGHRPVAAADRHVVGEIAQQLRAVRRVHHLGVEHHAVEPARVVGEGGERRALAHADHAEAGRQAGHAVAVAHPHLLARARCHTPSNSAQGSITSTKARPNSRWSDRLHLAAELRAHRLLP